MSDFLLLTDAELEARRQALNERLSIGCVGFQRAIKHINRERKKLGLLPFGSDQKPKPDSERPALDLIDWMTDRIEVAS